MRKTPIQISDVAQSQGMLVFILLCLYMIKEKVANCVELNVSYQLIVIEQKYVTIA